MMESLRYSPGFTGKQNNKITAAATAAFVALAPMYADLAALEAVVNPTDAAGVTTYKGVIERFDDSGAGECKYIRADFGLAIEGVNDKTVNEAAYLIIRTELGGKAGIMLLPYYTCTWTSGGVQIPVVLGGVAGESFAKAVSAFADSGLSEARTGQALGAVSQVPSTVHVVDTGECLGVLRVFQHTGVNAAVSCRPMSSRWR